MGFNTILAFSIGLLIGLACMASLVYVASIEGTFYICKIIRSMYLIKSYKDDVLAERDIKIEDKRLACSHMEELWKDLNRLFDWWPFTIKEL